MALFLRGKFRGFYKAGTSECVRDMFRFRKFSENKVTFELTRRDMMSTVKRFWKLESSSMTLIPLDPNEPRQGGKVEVGSLVFDVRTMTIRRVTRYGIYSDDFVTYGTFTTDTNPLEDDETLLKITENIKGSEDIEDKITFKFLDDELYFSHEINEDLLDPEVNHQIEENNIGVVTATSWSEKLFYGLGNL